jgi:hypothetical protein
MTIRKDIGLLLLSLALLGCQSQDSQHAQGTSDIEEGLDAEDFVLGADVGSNIDKSGGMIAVDDLPEEYRDLLEAWKLGGFVWEVKRSEALSDPALTAFLIDNLLVLLFEDFSSTQSSAYQNGRNVPVAKQATIERTLKELVLCGKPAAEALAETLAYSGDVFASLSTEMLMEFGREAAPPVAALLDRDKAAIRLRAATALGRLPSAGRNEVTVLARLKTAATEDSSDLVRVRATSSLGERGLWAQVGRSSGSVDLEPYRKALEECLLNPSEGVRSASASGLSTLGDQSAIPALIAAATTAGKADRMGELRAHASSLKSLSGEDFGWDMNEWRAWWRDAK